MLNRRRLLPVLLAAALLGIPCRAAPRIDIGLSMAGGYTIVDLEKASGYDMDYLMDYGQGHYKVTLSALLELTDQIQAGVEIGFHQLYWYEYSVPYGPTPARGEADWWTDGYLGMLQYRFTSMAYAQAGAGLHFFDGDPVVALSVSGGISPTIGPVRVPLFLRLDPIFGDGVPTPVSLGAGIQYTLGRQK